MGRTEEDQVLTVGSGVDSYPDQLCAGGILPENGNPNGPRLTRFARQET
jgi:hypothetical protein